MMWKALNMCWYEFACMKIHIPRRLLLSVAGNKTKKPSSLSFDQIKIRFSEDLAE